MVNGEVITPKDDILPGITRDVVVKLAGEKFPLKKELLTISMMNDTSELFITSSNKEIVPVVQIDDRAVSSKPGPITSEIMRLFRSYVQAW